MSIERLLAADVAMNLCILACVQLGLGRLNAKRIAAALSVLEADTVICRIAGIAFLRFWPFQALFCAFAGFALTAHGRRSSHHAAYCFPRWQPPESHRFRIPSGLICWRQAAY